MDISHLRQEYTKFELDISTVNTDPFEQFKKWFDEASASDILEPNAMCLSTAGINLKMRRVFQVSAFIKFIYNFQCFIVITRNKIKLCQFKIETVMYSNGNFISVIQKILFKTGNMFIYFACMFCINGVVKIDFRSAEYYI